MKKPLRTQTLGYSIIEILIAIVISLILLAGVLQIFLGTRNIYLLETDFSGLEENGRFLNDYLSRIVRLAGYRTPPSSGIFPEISTVFPSATAPFITGSDNTGFNGSDIIVLRYQGSGNGTGTPDGTVRDCLNQGVDSNAIATSTFSLSNNYELQCQAVNPNASPATNTQVLISGVETFQVLYGEDVNGDNTADRYVPASFPFLNMSNVVSIRVSFLLRSANQVNLVPQSITYNLAGSAYTTAKDKYLRQPVTFTIVLRNLLNEPS